MVIHVLIGADYLWNFQKGCTIRGKCDERVAVETELGWVLSGPMKGRDKCSDSHFAQVNFISSSLEKQESLKDVQRLWDLETLGIRDIEDEVHEAFKNSISFNEIRYSVQLPCKEGHPELSCNYSTSLHRLRTQVRKLEGDPEILREYAAIIEDQLHSGIIEKVKELEEAPRVRYLPHQAVVRKESDITKVRVVYEASSRKGKVRTCLNDCLHIGPPLTPLLYNIMLRFKKNWVILVGDIEKAFLNVEVVQEDRDCFRFLWVANPPYLSQVVVYRFCRVVFGVNTSPFLLNATLRHHIKKYVDCEPSLCQDCWTPFILTILWGRRNIKSEEVVGSYQKAQSRMAQGGLRLRKWLTNDAQMRAEIETDTLLENKQFSVSEEDTTYAKSSIGIKVGYKGQKVLGCEWDYEADVITLELKVIAERAKGLPITKRNSLKLLAGVFDPMWLISPVTVSAKVIFQKSCRLKIAWDEQLDGEIRKGVKAWIKGLLDWRRIVLKSCVYDHFREELVECLLYGFADASKRAACGVLYFVYRTSVGRYLRMLTSKIRVAPVKELSIPRLELMAALIMVKLLFSAEAALIVQAKVKRLKLWLDSKAALFWIRNRGECKQFVKHTVNEILRKSGKGQTTYHVASLDSIVSQERGVCRGSEVALSHLTLRI